jgi:hypothetical protein
MRPDLPSPQAEEASLGSLVSSQASAFWRYDLCLPERSGVVFACCGFGSTSI